MIENTDTQTNFLPSGSPRCETTWVGPPATRCTRAATVRLMYLPAAGKSYSEELGSGVMNACEECCEEFKKNTGSRGYALMV